MVVTRDGTALQYNVPGDRKISTRPGAASLAAPGLAANGLAAISLIDLTVPPG
jgi:hypothetical protein